jgi:hypothetical protein
MALIYYYFFSLAILLHELCQNQLDDVVGVGFCSCQLLIISIHPCHPSFHPPTRIRAYIPLLEVSSSSSSNPHFSNNRGSHNALERRKKG